MKFPNKTIIVNIIIFAISTIVVLLVGELIVRALYKDSTVLFPRYHTDAKYGPYQIRTIRPNSVFWHTSIDGRWKFITNSKGFRNIQEFTYRKPDGVLRILSIGDSHTQGYEVDQDKTFSSVLEKYLNFHGIPTEVINAGVSGFSTAEELIFLENEGIKYQPDYVVLGFFANDYEDNIKSGLFKLNENGELTIQKTTHLPGVKIQNLIYSLPLVKWLGENSYLYSLIFNNVWTFYKLRLAKKSKENVIEYAVATKSDFSNYQVELTRKLIERLYRFCNQNGIKLIIVDIPRLDRKLIARSSLTEEMLKTMQTHSNRLFTTNELFGDYIGSVPIHVPHGHRHITEFSHAIIGVTTGKYISEQISNLSSLSGRP